MKRAEIKTGETYTAARSSAQLNRDPEDGFTVKVVGDPINMEFPGTHSKKWVVPVESPHSADLRFLWSRRWACQVPGIEGRYLLQIRYIIETADKMPARLAAFEAKRQEYRRKRDEADAMASRIDASGIVKTNFIRGDHIDGEYLELRVPYDKVEALIEALNAAASK